MWLFKKKKVAADRSCNSCYYVRHAKVRHLDGSSKFIGMRTERFYCGLDSFKSRIDDTKECGRECVAYVRFEIGVQLGLETGAE